MKINAYLLTFAFLVTGSLATARAQQADSPPKLISQSEFTLGGDAAAVGIDGRFGFTFTVNADGSVSNVKKTAGFVWPCGKGLRKELIAAENSVIANISAAKFTPAVKNGVASSFDTGGTLVVGSIFQSAISFERAEAAESLPDITIVNVGTLATRAKTLPKAVYPIEAAPQRIRGTVRMDFLVDEKGKVLSAGPSSGHFMLVDSARSAACGAKFNPIEIKGKAVKFIGTLVYNFTPS